MRSAKSFAKHVAGRCRTVVVGAGGVVAPLLELRFRLAWAVVAAEWMHRTDRSFVSGGETGTPYWGRIVGAVTWSGMRTIQRMSVVVIVVASVVMPELSARVMPTMD
jgi:hypothetical protein